MKHLNSHEYVAKLAEGNPGAVNVMVMLMNRLGGDAFDVYSKLLSRGIKGSNIWILWKDICDRDFTRFIKAIEDARSEDSQRYMAVVLTKEPKNYGVCEVCKQKLGISGGYGGTGMCGPCCTGESETLEEKFETW